MKEALCHAFCDALSVRKVPIGLAVGTSFRRSNGDTVGFYISFDASDRSKARIEDDGLTFAMLEASGIDLSSGPRAEQFHGLLRQSRILLDTDESLLHTAYMPLELVPVAALEFVAFLIRVQEFMSWTKEAVEDTFKDDVIRAVQEHYNTRAIVYVADDTEIALPNSQADVVIVPPAGIPLALFIGTSEPKALEATLLWSDVRAKLAKSANVMLVLDSPKPKRIEIIPLQEQ